MRIILPIAAAMALALGACAPAGAQTADKALEAANAFMAKNASEAGVQTLPDGLQYKVLQSGPAGGAHPGPQDTVKVNYEGRLVSGQVFDSTMTEGGKPALFQVDQLVPAWTEALQMMKPGDVWMLYVPPKLGYGDKSAGPIPPNSVLIFKMQLIAVLPQGMAAAH
jgi:peptidylprolyl isomerase/FKBP-type peptidyl-prolyl cis-trans isomerase FklB